MILLNSLTWWTCYNALFTKWVLMIEVPITYLSTCYDGETIRQRLNRVHEAAVRKVFLQVHCSFHVDLAGCKFHQAWFKIDPSSWPWVLLTRNVQEHAKGKPYAGTVYGWEWFSLRSCTTLLTFEMLLAEWLLFVHLIFCQSVLCKCCIGFWWANSIAVSGTIVVLA